MVQDSSTELKETEPATMKQSKISTSNRRVTEEAKIRGMQNNVPAAAIELSDGTIITSETSSLLGTSAALILNAAKHLAGIDHSVKLIPAEMIEPIQNMKVETTTKQ